MHAFGKMEMAKMIWRNREKNHNKKIYTSELEKKKLGYKILLDEEICKRKKKSVNVKKRENIAFRT